MKILKIALLVFLVAFVNCQTTNEQCFENFLADPNNQDIADAVESDCETFRNSVRILCYSSYFVYI